ncbi:hypothetical protein B484DRAFT_141424 [Ochromonadaceae sp. CCMP2298]|nr:hypothetical protein B484DRAFT_141424 [Ochromonadaceae sp. CCMP2298]
MGVSPHTPYPGSYARLPDLTAVSDDSDEEVGVGEDPGQWGQGQTHSPAHALHLLTRIEAQHWAGVLVAPAPSAPLRLPSKPGDFGLSSVVRMFPMFSLCAPPPSTPPAPLAPTPSLAPSLAPSLPTPSPSPSSHGRASCLVSGTSTGRLVVWVVPWGGAGVGSVGGSGVGMGKGAGKGAGVGAGGVPYLVSASAPLPPPERSAVVDIKTGTLGNSQLISMALSGSVSVWHLNSALSPDTPTALNPSALPKRGLLGMLGLGGGKGGDKGGGGFDEAPSVMVRVFKIDPADMVFNFPPAGGEGGEGAVGAVGEEGVGVDEGVGTDAEGIGAGAGGVNPPPPGGFFSFFGPRRVGLCDPAVFPAQICFHPSLTLLGKNPSLLVGTEGGDVVKYNMDYTTPSMDAPILFPRSPFVPREFVHPLNAPSGFVLTGGNGERRGNKVFRELFHHHRERVVLLGVLGAGGDTVLSIDQGGTAALWRYEPHFFEGRCWFRPLRSASASARTCGCPAV